MGHYKKEWLKLYNFAISELILSFFVGAQCKCAKHQQVTALLELFGKEYVCRNSELFKKKCTQTLLAVICSLKNDKDVNYLIATHALNIYKTNKHSAMLLRFVRSFLSKYTAKLPPVLSWESHSKIIRKSFAYATGPRSQSFHTIIYSPCCNIIKFKPFYLMKFCKCPPMFNAFFLL